MVRGEVREKAGGKCQGLKAISKNVDFILSEMQGLQKDLRGRGQDWVLVLEG